MVGVQNKNAIKRAYQHIVDLVFLGRHGKHHAHEIGGVAQIVARVNGRLSHRVFVRQRGQGRQLGDQAYRRNITLLFVMQIHRVRVKRRHRPDQPGHHRHGVRVAAEAAQKKLHLLMHHGVVGHLGHKIPILLHCGQFTVEQQITHLHEIAFIGKLLDGVAAIQQFALVAVDKSDGRVARRGG